MARFTDRMAAGVCNISLKLLRDGGVSMICGLYVVLTAVLKSGTIPSASKRGLVIFVWKVQGNHQDSNNYCGITLLSVTGKVFAYLLLLKICSQLLILQRPEQSRFMPNKSTTYSPSSLKIEKESI